MLRTLYFYRKRREDEEKSECNLTFVPPTQEDYNELMSMVHNHPAVDYDIYIERLRSIFEEKKEKIENRVLESYQFDMMHEDYDKMRNIVESRSDFIEWADVIKVTPNLPVNHIDLSFIV